MSLTITIPAGSTSATFHYTPSAAGSFTLTFTNDAGLEDAAPLTRTAGAAPATAYTLAIVTNGYAGQHAKATVTPNGTFTGTVTLTPSGAGDVIGPVTLTFTGSASPQTAIFLPLYPGTLTVTGTNSGSLTNPAPATQTIRNISWPEFLDPDTPIGRAWLRSYADAPTDPESDLLIQTLTAAGDHLRTDWSSTSGPTYSHCVARESDCIAIPRANITFAYGPNVDTIYRLPKLPTTISGRVLTTEWADPAFVHDGEDHDLYLVVLDDTTGLPKWGYAWYNFNPVDLDANTWVAAGCTYVDFSNGKLQPDGYTGKDSAGSYGWFGIPNIDEVLSGTIGHAMRYTLSGSRNINFKYAWPARNSSAGGGSIPYGARLMMRADWLAAHRSEFGPQTQVLFDMMANQGMIDSDNSGPGIGWAALGDPRWDWDDIGAIASVPINTTTFRFALIPRGLEIVSGPTMIPIGQTGTWTVRRDPPDDEQYSASFGVYLPDGSYDSSTYFGIDDAHPTPSFTYTPTVAGFHQIKAGSANWWNGNTVQVGFLSVDTSTLATVFTLDLSGDGLVGQPITVTATLDGVYAGTITLAPSGCGLSTPVVLVISPGTLTVTATFTPTTVGTLVITGHAEPALIEPSPVPMLIGTGGSGGTSSDKTRSPGLRLGPMRLRYL